MNSYRQKIKRCLYFHFHFMCCPIGVLIKCSFIDQDKAFLCLCNCDFNIVLLFHLSLLFKTSVTSPYQMLVTPWINDTFFQYQKNKKLCNFQPKESSNNYRKVLIFNLSSVQSVDISPLEHDLKQFFVDKNKHIKKRYCHWIWNSLQFQW